MGRHLSAQCSSTTTRVNAPISTLYHPVLMVTLTECQLSCLASQSKWLDIWTSSPRNSHQEGTSAIPGQRHPVVGGAQSSTKTGNCSGQYFSREPFQIPYKSNRWPWINHSSHLCAEREKTSQQLMHAKALGGDGWGHYGAFRQWRAIRESHFIE